MHFEILVEDQSGKVALEAFIPKIIGDQCTFNIHSYKGIGHIPRNLNSTLDPKKRVLLNQLPRLLRGYGKAFEGYSSTYRAAVIVICDLDGRDKTQFLSELEEIFDNCDPRPEGCVCLCIEEGEAWLMGDKCAVRAAFPNTKASILDAYEYDSICGTWEVLANAVYAGGAAGLSAKGSSEVGRMKSVWANEIAPKVEVEMNKSPSFQYFVGKLADLSTENQDFD